MSSKTNRILVIEDNRMSQMKLVYSVQQQGYEAVGVANGKQGLEKLREGNYDMVLTDIVMPVMDGYELLEFMKQDETLRHIPVVVISGVDEVDSVVKCLRLGALSYLSKPFEPEILKARIEGALSSKKQYDVQLKHVQELHEHNQDLDAYAHTVAHDLTNPLAVIMGMSDLFGAMYVDQIDDTGREILDTIMQNCKRMKNIMEALLLLANLRHRQPEIELLDMTGVIADVVDRLSFQQKQISATISTPDSLPLAYGYAPWVEQVWVNYISNAFKYGGNPSHVEIGSTELGNGFIRYWVSDNGPGIPKEAQTELFKPFKRLEPQRALGHGVGLSIVDRIILNLGGEVGVDSEVGEGSCFWFTLPAGTSNIVYPDTAIF